MKTKTEFKKHFHIALPQTLYDKVEEYAKENDMSVTEFIRGAIRDTLHRVTK